MTSNINFAAINENFPVAGQDNDTQTFRDNFDTIKTNFSAAKTEITDLQDNAARTDEDNDFANKIVLNAILSREKHLILEAGEQTTDVDLDFENGNHQSFVVNKSVLTLTLSNFPSNLDAVSKVTLELYNKDSSARSVTFSLSGSLATTVKCNSDFPSRGSAGSIPTITLPTNTTTATIVEIWRYSESTFFMNYLGLFS